MRAKHQLLTRTLWWTAGLAVLVVAVAGAFSGGIAAGTDLAPDAAIGEQLPESKSPVDDHSGPLPPPVSAPAPPAPDHPPTEAPATQDLLRREDHGDAVDELQSRLEELGYWSGTPDGSYGDLTEQAVMAFQKAENLSPDGVAGPETRARLDDAQRPTLTDIARDRIEIDLDRQLLFLVVDGSVRWTINTSTGREGMATPVGRFRIEREIDGIRHAPLGDLYRPKYFHEGYAVHGSPSIPSTPASHGCARVSDPAMDLLWSTDLATIGTEVRVT